MGLLLVIISGCTKTFSGLIKSSDRSVAQSPQSTLIKPKFDDSEKDKSTSQISSEAQTVQPVRNSSDPMKEDIKDSPKEPEPDQKAAVSKQPVPPTSASAVKDNTTQTEDAQKPPKRLTGAEQRDFPEEKDQKRGDKPLQPVRTKQGPDEDEMLGSEIEERNPEFRKHDHSKYVTKIKNAAIDVVNRERDSVYVRMCKHNTTDEWSLGVYFVQGKSYYFRTYVWDPIENLWTETFESEKRPYSGFKNHLSFSSAGKKCVPLKGSDKE